MGNSVRSVKKQASVNTVRIQDTIQIDYAGSITFNDDCSSIYLTDHTTHQIVHINLTDLLTQRVIVEKRNNSFPWAIRYLDNCLYVTDTFQHSLTMYDTEGNILYVFGSYKIKHPFNNLIKTDLTSLNNPREIATDKRGILYVCDNGNSRILVFAPDLYFITFVQVPYPSDVIINDRELLVYSNERCVVSVVNEKQRRLDTVESYPLGLRKMSLYYIERMGVDREGNLLFFDATGGQILVIDEITFRVVKRFVDSKTQYLNYMQRHRRDNKVAVLLKERDQQGNSSVFFRYIQL